MMETFFASGHAADMILAVLFFEGVWLARRGWSLAQVTKALGAAVFIVLAVRAALVGAPWYWVALALSASFPIHLMDLRDRLKPGTR